MAKQTHNQKIAKSNTGGATLLEHTVSFDDSLLPDAQELVKLKELDPNIIDWIKERTAKEQDERHFFNRSKINFVNVNTKREFWIDVFKIVAALIVIGMGMYLSYLLIIKDKIIEGSIFGGAVIIFCVNAFLKFGNIPKKQ
ncbi:MAG TPA: hypothetical protein PLS12_05485 [Bacteroidales bacterium]|jgi:uncharacterized membrane protein|nr:hypothetical protein [Bacteroidales bacterium]